SISGTSDQKFPKRRISAHICAYRQRQAPIAWSGDPLQIAWFLFGIRQKAGVVAMQKVVGSNPISRFQESPAQAGLFLPRPAMRRRYDLLTPGFAAHSLPSLASGGPFLTTCQN
ncbi:MAG TPA: hypothetical protein VNL97_04800, partial [Solirubrobacterales bacterium]|nr:hypothetical protein [Solirubrobacterales bacterium]